MGLSNGHRIRCSVLQLFIHMGSMEAVALTWIDLKKTTTPKEALQPVKKKEKQHMSDDNYIFSKVLHQDKTDSEESHYTSGMVQDHTLKQVSAMRVTTQSPISSTLFLLNRHVYK